MSTLFGAAALWIMEWLTSPLLQGIEEQYDLSIWAIVSTALYGLIGIVLFLLGYLALDRFIRLDLRRELVEDQNLALGVMLAGFFVALALMVAAVIR